MTPTTIEPVVATVTVPLPPDRAFELFTDGIGRWWPWGTHSVGGNDRIETIVCEGGLGGRIYERWHDGHEHVWGTITAWDPPAAASFTWRPEHSTPADTDVTVEFEPFEEGTRVRLTHVGWEALGEGGPAARASYDAGWPGVLSQYLGRSIGPLTHRALGRAANNQTWSLLDGDDPAALLAAAFASSYHWAKVGGPVERARGDWLISRAAAVTGDAGVCARHAELTLAATEAGDDGFRDFDHAYSAEAMARAAAAGGDLDQAAVWWTKARALGDAIVDPEDKAIFDGDLAADPWFGFVPGG
jgi:uncharacterized protein YndB with AHSA1/START domain